MVTSAPTPAAAAHQPAAARFPILLATAGAADVRPATRVARALAAERGAVPHALRVHDVPALDASALGVVACPADLAYAYPYAAACADGGDADGAGDSAAEAAAVAAGEAAAVRAELAAADPSAAWPVRVTVGTPSACIVREAARVGAALIVVGLRPHGFADRVLGDKTAAHVMRDAPCPVLGVADGAAGAAALTGLPRRVVVGVDFGRTSVRAAHAALALAADGGTLVLVHVAPGAAPAPDPAESDEGAALVRALGVGAAFERLVTELAAAAPAGRAVAFACEAVASVPGQGVARALLDAADRHGADLVAVATQRVPRLARILLGSVTAELAREGRHSLLVVPAGCAAG